MGTAGANITLTGTGFVPTSTVSVNGTQRTTTYTSATQVTVALTAADLAASGSESITVSNPAPGGGTSAGENVQIGNPVPTVSSVSPASVPAGSPDTKFTIMGTGFESSSAVSWNGAVLAATFVNSTQLTVVAPAATLGTAGVQSIQVSDPAPSGGVSNLVSVSVVDPPPALTAIAPHTVNTGTAATITLSGTGFTANSVVQWNGAAHSTIFVNSATLQVELSATDTATDGTDNLTVVNPTPGGGTSAPVALVVTSLPIPAISSVTYLVQTNQGCSSIAANIIGINMFSEDFAIVNGLQTTTITAPYSIGNGQYQMTVFVPLAALSSGTLTFTVAMPYFTPQIASEPYTPSGGSPLVAVCANPEFPNVYPSSTFAIALSASEVNITAVPSVTIGSLPSGVQLNSSPTALLSGSGATLSFTAASSLTPGSYTIPYTGQVGTTTFSGSVPLTVQSGTPPGFSWIPPAKVGVPIGGATQVQVQSTFSAGPPDYSIVPSISGLPTGVTATFSPASFIPGQAVTINLSAVSSAPISQNVTVTLTGTPEASVSPVSTTFSLDVTPPPGSLAGNRTDLVATGGTPYSGAYDSTHNQIFASDPTWNRIDVISNVSHKITASIDIRDPKGVDLSPDNSFLWVATGSQQVFAIDTTSLKATRYLLPTINQGAWGASTIFTLSDGTLLVQTFSISTGDGPAFIWSPSTNSSTAVSLTGPLLRSGDHSKVFGTAVNSASCQTSIYNVTTKTITTLPATVEGCSFDAVNTDGSRFVGSNNSAYGLYDGNGNLIGDLPNPWPSTLDADAAFVFSADGSTLYRVGGFNLTATLVYDVASLTLKGVAPTISAAPNSNSVFFPVLAGVDATGMIFGIQNLGISFDDSTFYQTYGTTSPTGFESLWVSPNAGPLSGGTVSAPNTYDPGLIPDVWYGQIRGSVPQTSGYSVNMTSPPADALGPVNLKLIYPDGTEGFIPQGFTYSAYPQYSILSGASPSGGVPGQISGYGLPADGSGAGMTIGGTTATIIPPANPPSGVPQPSTFLNYTIPAGNPGWADLAVTTANGSGSLPKSVFYAKSVTDYSSPDTFTAVLYDRKRNQVYLSANDHIDVFSMSSLEFVTALRPQILGTNSLFGGLALTPDGSQLLAANILDGSLAVMNPDSPSSTSAVHVATISGQNNCTVGPLYVAATSNGNAFVVTGSVPGTSGCSPQGNVYIVNLTTKAVTSPGVAACNLFEPYPFTTTLGVDSPLGGSTVVMGGGTYGSACIYSVPSGTYAPIASSTSDFSASISPDGNILSTGVVLGDPSSGATVGRLAHPVALYGAGLNTYSENALPTNALLDPRFNDSGSLYYWAFPNYFEIVDVPTGRLRIRFSLSETIQNVAAPLALDAGHDVFLITNQGLTVVDLGSAPLSIGHLSTNNVSPGSLVQVRGSGFASGISVKVGGVAATGTFTDENTLTFTVPAVASGVQDLTLTNPDGDSYTLQNAILIP
jgi:hypothetical protein